MLSTSIQRHAHKKNIHIFNFFTSPTRISTYLKPRLIILQSISNDINHHYSPTPTSPSQQTVQHTLTLPPKQMASKLALSIASPRYEKCTSLKISPKPLTPLLLTNTHLSPLKRILPPNPPRHHHRRKQLDNIARASKGGK